MSTRWYTPNKLRQLQYRSYNYPIAIYNYPSHLLPVLSFEARLTKAANNYITRLVSADPIAYLQRPEGDETPDGYSEVAFLRNVFQNRGCALGFRTVPGPSQAKSGGKIHWLCFDKPAQQMFELWDIEVPGTDVVLPLFDKVGVLEKASTVKKGTVAGHREHREWYDALERAVHPVVKLKLTYKNKGRDQLREWDVMKAAKAGRTATLETAASQEDVGMRDFLTEEREMQELGELLGDVGVEEIWEKWDRRDSVNSEEESGVGIGGDKGKGLMTPVSAPVTIERSRMDRLAAGEYV